MTPADAIIRAYELRRELAKEAFKVAMGIGYTTLRQAVRRETWRHL